MESYRDPRGENRCRFRLAQDETNVAIDASVESYAFGTAERAMVV